MTDTAIPTLPARDMDATLAFFDRLGFRLVARYGEYGGAYAILARADLELHFFEHGAIDPKQNYAGCYIRVEDVDGLYAELVANGVPIPHGPDDKPWGMREFAVLDPCGNLLRIGHRLAARGS